MSEQDVIEIMANGLFSNFGMVTGEARKFATAAHKALQEAGFVVLPVSELTGGQRIIAGLRQAAEMAKAAPFTNRCPQPQYGCQTCGAKVGEMCRLDAPEPPR